MGGSPPAVSGRHTPDLTPYWRRVSRSTAASGGKSSRDETANMRPARTCCTGQGYWSCRMGSDGRQASSAQ